MEVSGRDLAELFRNACFAVFDNMLHLDRVVARESRHVELRSESLEGLFMDWLRELLFRFSTEYFIVSDVPALNLEGNRLVAEIRGERFDPKRHRIKIEIKTPTYHMFRIEQRDDGCRATVVFDV